MRQFLKCVFIYCFSGFIYVLMELIYRGFSDITMFFLAGICGLICMGLNDIYTYELDFTLQVFIGTVCTTIGEYVFGILYNSDYHIWDYRKLSYNIDGQICLYFTLVWVIIITFSIPLLDYIEWKFFDYEKNTPPYYKIFGKKIFQFKSRSIL